MAWSIAILFVALDVAGVYFNMRMLLSCFKSDTKRGFLQTYRPLVIYQFIYQVSVLEMNTIEAWDVVHVQRDGFCNYFKIAAISMNIFIVSNFTGMLIIGACYPVVYKNQYLSPALLMVVPLCLGFIGSAVFWWCGCYLHRFQFQVVAIIFCAVFLTLLLVKWKKSTQVTQLVNQTGANLKATSPLWDNLLVVKEKKKACFLTTLLFVCCGVVIAPVLAREILPDSSFEKFDMMLMFMTNVIVGIGLPITLIQLFHFIDDEDHVNNFITNAGESQWHFCTSDCEFPQKISRIDCAKSFV